MLPSRRSETLTAVTIVIAAFAAVHGTRVIDNLPSVHWEDKAFFQYVQENIASVGDCVSHVGYWPGLYRPLSTNLYYYLGHVLAGDSVVVLHAVNMVVLLANALLLAWIALEVLEPPWAALVGAFAVSRHALVEIVLHTCEMQGLLYVLFGLAACKASLAARTHQSGRLVAASALFAFLAMFAKEAAISVPIVLFAWSRLGSYPSSRVAAPPQAARQSSRIDALLGWSRGAGYLAAPLMGTAAAVPVFVLWAWPAWHGRGTGFRYDFSVAHVIKAFAVHLCDFSNVLVDADKDPDMSPRVLALVSYRPVTVAVTLLLGLELVVLIRPALASTPTRRALAFGFALFVIATLPFAFFEERLPMRYSYFGHAGLAICAAALVRAGWRATARWRLPEALDISPSRAAPEMPASATSGGPLPVDAPAQAAR
jgi:hypothetical protein